MVFIRKINVCEIKKAVKDLCIEANCHLGDDVLRVIRNMSTEEKSPVGQEVLEQLVENAVIADKEEIPMCQDTGMVVVFLEIGQDVLLTGGDITAAVNNGVRDGYTEGYLRKSVVNDPFHRVNTGDNTPAVIHTQIVPGDQVKITVLPKGGGSENMSAFKMLKPGEGAEGVKKFVVESIQNAGPNPCPPIIVGVGIGGTMEKAAIMAKHALTRPLGQESDDPETAKIERDLLKAINKLGIGPQGFGGNVTAFAVHIEKFATHIASLPVAVNLSCHAYRHKTVII